MAPDILQSGNFNGYLRPEYTYRLHGIVGELAQGCAYNEVTLAE